MLGKKHIFENDSTVKRSLISVYDFQPVTKQSFKDNPNVDFADTSKNT